MCDVTLTAGNKPVAIQSNPAYDTTIRESAITTVDMQSNPAYGRMMGENITQSKSETVF